ncbi:MAG: CHRD domain-containing protein [Candidatus Baltobacteraceae bacterium]
MNVRRIALVAGAFAIVMGTAALADSSKPLTVQMKALNDSKENGTAIVSQDGDNLKVVIKLDNGTTDPQPTHIHAGTCANINKAPEYPLESTVNGEGTSIVKGVKLSDLTSGKYAINVHKSTSDLGTYVSCGDIMEEAKPE